MGAQINKAIVIGTYLGRENWLADCHASLPGHTYKIPVLTVSVPWELNAIKWVYEHTDLDEFLFLQDTVVVKDGRWIAEVFDHPGSVSLCHKPFFMYLGKYRRDILKHMNWPEVKNKRQAVTNEGEWTYRYADTAMSYDPERTRFLWDLDDAEVYEERHGRLNKVLENEHIIKYKGTWSPEMIPA